MDWMRCNRCYRAMLNTTKSFSLTHCGHVYCSQCLGEMGSNCRRCGSVNFTLMALEKPPKLEKAVNYFAPLEDLVEITGKATNFQEEQMMIAVRGTREIENKYKALKTTVEQLVQQTQEETAQCQQIAEEVRKVQQAREQKLSRNCLLKELEMSSKNVPRHYQDERNRSSQRSSTNRCITNNPSASVFSAQYREAPRTLENPEIHGYRITATKYTPKYSYNPSPANSSIASSVGRRYAVIPTPDSGFTSLAANSTARVEGFLVPSVARVPKSAATAKKKTPTDARISVPIPHNECRS